MLSLFILNEAYIKQTLKEEKLWKVGEADTFRFDDWELTLRKEEKIYNPFNYSVNGLNGTGSSISRRYKTMEDAFLHIVNKFNENANLKNRYDRVDDLYV